MSNFKGDYLRVSKPVTTNGMVPKMINGEIVYKESHLPVTALKNLNKRNDKLPSHLKMKIDRIETGPKKEVVEEEDLAAPVKANSKTKKQ